MHKTKSWYERAIEKSKKVGDCLVFKGSINNKGYGQIKSNNKNCKVHRLSYQMFKGEIPEGLIVRHTCDNPSCWNPEHLLVGTQADNTNDMISRNRNTNGCLGELNVNAKLNGNKVKEIKRLLKHGVTQKVISEKFLVSNQLISCIKTNKIWKTVEI